MGSSVMSIAQEKNRLREQMKQRRREFSEADRLLAGERCQAALWEREEFMACDMLFSYVSYGLELPTGEIIQRALEQGMRVAVPKVTGEGKMDFFEIHSLSECKPGAFGIPEPEERKERIVFPEQFSRPAVLVPGLAFSKAGARLGYGGGYYDRYFKRHVGVFLIGLAYRFSVLEKLPAELHDLAVALVLEG